MGQPDPAVEQHYAEVVQLHDQAVHYLVIVQLLRVASVVNGNQGGVTWNGFIGGRNSNCFVR
jgi:hypothetical protein